MTEYELLTPYADAVLIADGAGGHSAVVDFFAALLCVGVSFHPDTPADDIGYMDSDTWVRLFDDAEAKHLDLAMDRCFGLVGDVYEVACNVWDTFQDRRATA